MLDINLEPDKTYTSSSKIIDLVSGKKYYVSSFVQGFKGEPFCGYFGVIIFNKKNKEIDRKIQWLNDFSGDKKKIEIVFKASPDSDHLIICYRINEEVPIKSNCKYSLDPPEKANFEEAEIHLEDRFESVENYSLPRGKELSNSEELILEKNLVWVFGAPRSGTSWLALQLLSYKTMIMNEPLIGMHLGISRNTIRDRIVRNIELLEKDPDYFFSYRYRQVWKYYLRKFILNRIYSQFQNLSKKIIIKEPGGTIASDIISESLPNSKILFLLRDGRDVIDSNINALEPGSWAVRLYGITPITPETRLLEIKYRAKMWVRTMEILMKTFEIHNKELRMKIKYEELRKNTLELLQKIYEFIGIEPEKNDLKKIVEKYSFSKIAPENKGLGKKTRIETPGKWKENLSEEEKVLMEEIMRKTLGKLGY